jgi:hypothetical protein
VKMSLVLPILFYQLTMCYHKMLDFLCSTIRISSSCVHQTPPPGGAELFAESSQMTAL